MEARAYITVERGDDELEIEVIGWVEHGAAYDVASVDGKYELTEAEADRAAEALGAYAYDGERESCGY